MALRHIPSLAIVLAVVLILGCSGAAPGEPSAQRTPAPLPTRTTVPAFGLCDPVSYARPVTAPAGQAPHSVGLGDLTGDGRTDLIVVDADTDAVVVLAADAAGRFRAGPESQYAVGRGPRFATVGDFNGDGKADVAVANSRSEDVSVLLGDGAGKLNPAPGAPVTVGTGSSAMSSGDFNRDGKLDLVVGMAGNGTPSVLVLLGDGAGRFAVAPGSPVAVGSSPALVTLVANDFDRDGILDLIVGVQNIDHVVLLPGNDAGGFKPAPYASFPVTSGAAAITTGDFNGDGVLDLGTVNVRTNDVSVLLGNTTGGFSPAAKATYPVSGGPISITSTDANGDGKLDLLIVVLEADDITFLLGDGAGAFNEMRPPPRIITGGKPANPGLPFAQYIIATDLNGDQKPDLVTANPGSSDISVLLNTCR